MQEEEILGKAYDNLIDRIAKQIDSNPILERTFEALADSIRGVDTTTIVNALNALAVPFARVIDGTRQVIDGFDYLFGSSTRAKAAALQFQIEGQDVDSYRQWPRLDPCPIVKRPPAAW